MHVSDFEYFSGTWQKWLVSPPLTPFILGFLKLHTPTPFLDMTNTVLVTNIPSGWCGGEGGGALIFLGFYLWFSPQRH